MLDYEHHHRHCGSVLRVKQEAQGSTCKRKDDWRTPQATGGPHRSPKEFAHAPKTSAAPSIRCCFVSSSATPGGLTTFSSFSGEVVLLMRQDRLVMACTAIALHLGGSLLLTFAGMATASLLRGR